MKRLTNVVVCITSFQKTGELVFGEPLEGMALKETATAVLKATEDPYFSETICHVLRLNKMEEGKPPGPACTQRNYGRPTRGIGLHGVIKPVRFYVKTREQKWLLPVVMAGTIGGLVLIGYVLGKGAK